jgi:peptidyl-prolyl cis-trans isomerase D
MIRFLQKKGTTQKVLWAILIGIVCISMVAFLGSYFTDVQGSTVAGVYATIGNQQLTTDEIREVARNVARQQLQGRQVPEQLMPYFMQRAADQLIARKAVLEQADRMGIKVTDAEVLDFFHKGEIGRQLYPNGKYVGREQAAQVIYANTGLSAEKFQQVVKDDMVLSKLFALIQGGVTVPASEIKAEYQKQNVKVKFDYALINTADLAKTVNVTEPELRAYYEKHKDELKNSIPEQRKIQYMVIDSSKQPVTITNEDYQKAYQQNQSEYKIPEEVDVRHILVKTKEQALDIKKQLESGADFAALAKKYSEDPGSKDTGGLYKNTQRGRMVPEFDKAAFELAVGKISDPVQTSFGFHILKVDAHRQERTRPLEEVKKELEATVRQQKQAAQADALATQILSDARSAGMEKAAAKHNLSLTTTDFDPRDASLPGIGSSPEAMAQIFNLQEDTPGKAQAGNTYLIAQVTDIKPPATPTFEQARKQIEERYRNERAQQLLMQRSQELADKARAMRDLKKAAKEMGFAVKTSDLATPGSQVADIGLMSQAAPMAFDLKKGEISLPVRAEEGAAVLQIVDHQEPSADDYAKQSEQIREQLAGRRADQAVSAFAQEVQQRMMKDGTIKINKQEQTRLRGSLS